MLVTTPPRGAPLPVVFNTLTEGLLSSALANTLGPIWFDDNDKGDNNYNYMGASDPMNSNVPVPIPPDIVPPKALHLFYKSYEGGDFDRHVCALPTRPAGEPDRWEADWTITVQGPVRRPPGPPQRYPEPV